MSEPTFDRFWKLGDDIQVHPYDVAVVKSWLRGLLSSRREPHPDPQQERFMAEFDVFMSRWLAGEDGDIAMGIGMGRLTEKQSGTEVLQLTVDTPKSRRVRRGWKR